MYVQQLTIFDALDDVAIQMGRPKFKDDILELIYLRLEEMGIDQYFEPELTKIGLRTCANHKRLFVTLLSNIAYLKDVQFYPAFPQLYECFLKDYFSVVNSEGFFKDGIWMHKRSTIEWSNFRDDYHLYQGFYYYTSEVAEKTIEGIIKTGFEKDLMQ